MCRIRKWGGGKAFFHGGESQPKKEAKRFAVKASEEHFEERIATTCVAKIIAPNQFERVAKRARNRQGEFFLATLNFFVIHFFRELGFLDFGFWEKLAQLKA